MKEAEVLKQISELERLASVVLEAKRRNRSKRPIVIEFCGSPKAGKTSAISSLDIFLRRNNFRTKVLTERASVCPINNKFDPIFNIWTGCAALNQISEELSANSRKIDIIIMDRGIFDALCWFEWQKMHNILRDDDYQRFTSFFTSPRFRMMIDLIFIFDSSSETSTDREYRNLLTRKEGSIMRKNVLDTYRDSITSAEYEYGELFRKVIKYNTDAQDQNKVSYKVTKHTLEALRGLAEEKIASISREKIENLPEIFEYSKIESILSDSVDYIFRDDVESDGRRVQLLPVAVFRQKGSNKIMVGVKTQKAVSKTSAERNRTLAYFGGHVREEDASFLDDRSVLATLKQCLYREIKEELGIDVDPKSENPTCIWVRDGTNSEKHLAIVFIFEEDFEKMKIAVDGEEFARYEKKGRVGTGDILDAADIMNGSVDSWTSNIITNILKMKNGHVEDDDRELFWLD